MNVPARANPRPQPSEMPRGLALLRDPLLNRGTAFTEQQVAILKRHTSNVVVNFDPDAAGANAAEKSIALLTEEGFAIRIVTLDGGLDPDRFVRERGVEAYKEAIRGARRQSDYLIDRARQLFPGSTPEQTVKAKNYLLPHIRRIPEMIAREQFANDAAQRLGIGSAVMREELRQAALRRRDHVDARPAALSEVERVLLRVLANTEIESAYARHLAAETLSKEPGWFEHLAAFPALQALAAREAKDPMDVVENPAQKALLAEALLGETRPPDDREVESALQEIEERAIESRIRGLRAQIAEAERRGDHAALALLTQQKLDLDRGLKELHKKHRGPKN